MAVAGLAQEVAVTYEHGGTEVLWPRTVHGGAAGPDLDAPGRSPLTWALWYSPSLLQWQ